MRKLLLASLAMGTLLLLLGAPAGARVESGGTPQGYIVVFNQPGSIPANAPQLVAAAGGTIDVRWDQIGALRASSADPAFAQQLSRNAAVHAVSVDAAPRWVPTPEQLSGDAAPASAENNGGTYSPTGPDPQPMPDALGREQWDKMRMNATVTGSYAVQRGRRDVVVAFLDTGVEIAHLDIAPNLDVVRSRSFVPWEPDIDDHHGHGSWIASAIAAPINGIGISGVAPEVTLVSLKVCGVLPSPPFLPFTATCPFSSIIAAMYYSALNRFDVASMSIGGYLNHTQYNAFWVALNRAVQFMRQNGVLPVAALGNDGLDLSFGGFMRDWKATPAEVPGVVGVSATGYRDDKAFYSNYGVDATDVSAPGGSTRDYSGVPGSGEAPGYRGLGRVLGAWSSESVFALFPPDQREEQCFGTDPNDTVCSYYAWVQGTSMATPHVSGVAALIISQYGDFESRNPNHAHMAPTKIEQILQITANNQPCPEPRTVVQGPGMPIPVAVCQGQTGFNNFFGKGIVDALKAVTFHTQGPPVGG